jgi:hypothetical protein
MATKTRAQMKRSQKAALKRKQRAKSKKGKPRVSRPEPAPKSALPEDFTDEVRNYWIAHGVNFLVSDYAEGEWKPMFPEIYTGTAPDDETVATRLVSAFGKEVKSMTKPQRAVLAYALEGPEAHYLFKRKAELLLADQEDPQEAARKPHQPLVWEMFHDRIRPALSTTQEK